MKIAVLMSGQPRTVRSRWRTFYDHVLKHLPNFDLFIHTSSQFDVDNDFFQTLKPRIYCVEDQFPLNEFEDQLRPIYFNEINLKSYSQQIFGYKRVCDLMTDYEVANNIHYTHVIRCRPDILYYGDIKLEHFDLDRINQIPNKSGEGRDNYWNTENNEWMTDIFVFGPIDAMRKMMHLYDWAVSEGCEKMKSDNPWIRRMDYDGRPCPTKYWAEAILKFYLKDLGVEPNQSKVTLEETFTRL